MESLTCKVSGCDASVAVKKSQLCKPHYNRWHYAGDYNLISRDSGVCKWCGAPTVAMAKGPVRSYCSAECRKALASETRKRTGAYANHLARSRAKTAARLSNKFLCAFCGIEFESRRSNVKFCSHRCTVRWNDINNPKRCEIDGCDRGVRAKGLCVMHWRRKARAEGREKAPVWDETRKANWKKREALKRGANGAETFEYLEVFDRDRWVCGLCHEAIDPVLKWPEPLSVSLDHIVPLSKGGSHSLMNVQAAHLVCNVSKGNREEEARR